MKTLLQIVQQACGEMGLTAPNYVAGNTASDTVQMLALLNGIGGDLSREFDWQALQKAYTFNTTGAASYPLPSDYDRQIDRTHYDKSKRWEMLGPESPQQWEFLTSAYISVGPRLRYRLMGNALNVWPTTNTGETVGYEYISNAWVTGADTTVKSSFTLDTDVCIFPDRLMITGLKLRYFSVKGFNTQEYQVEFMRYLSVAKSNDAGSSTLSFAPKLSSVLIGWENIPDSGYGQ
jgi:hypothetical protein